MKTSIKNTGILAALSIGIFFTSCQKQDMTDPSGKTFSGSIDSTSFKSKKADSVTSNVRFVNASFDVGQATLYIANKKENKKPVKFGEFTDYAKAKPSVPREPMRIMSQKDTLLVNSSGFYQDNFYSVYLTGLKTDGSLSMILSHDDMTAPQAGNARVKFVNAAMNSGYLNVLYGNNVLCWGQQYGVTSPCKELPAGDYNFGIATYGSRTPVISVATTLEAGKIYTIYTQNIVANGAATLDAKVVANN